MFLMAKMLIRSGLIVSTCKLVIKVPYLRSRPLVALVETAEVRKQKCYFCPCSIRGSL